MKFSESWLRTFVDPQLDSDALAELLTMAGLEVEENAPVAPPFTGVVVARIVSLQKHPNADRLNVCQVDAGEGALRQIVCGAPNAAAGLIIPCALPGAVLPGDFRIKPAKMRGVESLGMLCSARELGISEDAEGLLALPADAPVGQDIRAYLHLDERLFTLKLTPNRADCLSLSGIAREVSALTGVPARYPQIVPAAVTSAARREVVLEAPAACPRYCGRVIEGVDAKAKTPAWMKSRLEGCGLRSISALVDVTNYILLELGQPLHAFDNDKLTGVVRARMAQEGETLTLLNGQTVRLTPDVLLIADDARPLAMAGVMGGEGSGITEDAGSVFLESAFFAPRAIAGRARRYNFSSDASHRYERGVDYANCRNALERATQLVLEICGGKAGPVTETVGELPSAAPVVLRAARAQSVIGVPVAAADIADMLRRLALPFTQAGDVFTVTPPSYRFDIEIEADLIEEIARMIGYDRIPAADVRGRLSMLPQPEASRSHFALRHRLADREFQEVINFAFVPEVWEADFAANAAPIRLANPIASHLSAMRSGLIGGLIETLKTNLNRKQSRVRIFELGRCFGRTASDAGASAHPLDVVPGFTQPWRLAALIYGQAAPEGWGTDKRRADFFDLKGDLESLFAPEPLAFERTTHPALHPGRCARILRAGVEIGVIGELHPQWTQKYELPEAPIVCELKLEALENVAVPSYAEVSKFQPALRDIALVLPQETPLSAVLTTMRAAAPAIVGDIRLFDVYQGKGIAEGQKSLAFRLTLQGREATLTDAEMDQAVGEVVQALAAKHGAKLRE